MAGESSDTQEFGASDTLHHGSGTDVTRITSAQNAMLGAFGILIFAFINYPFLPTSLAVEYKTVRLLFEGVILLTLALAQANSGGRTFVAVLLAIGLYLVNYAVGGDNIDNVLSYSNKLLLLLLLTGAVVRNHAFANALRRLWVKFWLYTSVMGLLGFFLFFTGLISPTLITAERQDYYHFPLVGNFLLKATDLVRIPRYTGFMIEPVYLGFYFGFNMIVAERLFEAKRAQRGFLLLNLAAGLLTASYAFAVFLALYFLLRIKSVARVVSNPGVLFFLAGAAFLAVPPLLARVALSVGPVLQFSSFGDRFDRYTLSLEFLRNAPIKTLLFGAGIIPFENAIGLAASSGLLTVLASRGILILAFWLLALRQKSRGVPGLFAYFLLYGLVVDYWHHPLFIIAVALVSALPAFAPSLEMRTDPLSARVAP